MLLDDHGQPLNRMYGRKRLNDRAIDELIGVSRGIISDGNVSQKEAEFLSSWMEANVSFCGDRLVNQLYCRIQEMLIDKHLDKNEQVELLSILSEFTGESSVVQAESIAATLPVCKPHPSIEFPTMSFCLTGKFAYGPRRACEEVIKEREGKISKNVTQQLDYLVIGTFCSSDWAHTSYGRKIEKAVEYREKSYGLAIITEDHWARSAFAMA